jgi:3-deoxy-manno-octulosonate cytidylyltransferase (CMP-KDO synthetase)
LFGKTPADHQEYDLRDLTMRILGIIPARYASTRFPGKPLAVIDGKTMIRRVYEQALKCDKLNRVMVATDNEAILDHVRLFSGHVLMTGRYHRSGTERCNEVVEILRNRGEEYDYVINIQGDEPFINPEQISLLIECFRNKKTRLATLIKKITEPEELTDSNIVKVTVGNDRSALLFSRSPIPFTRGADQASWLSVTTYYKHIGIYGYQALVLGDLVKLPETPLEMAESLEQLRWLEHGFRIQTQITDFESVAIDTPLDLLKITNRT